MMKTKPLKYLSAQTLQSLNVSTKEVIQCMEHLIRGQQTSTVWHTPKSVIQPGDGRYMMSTLSASDSPDYLAVKSVILNPRNTEKGLPQINGLIMLLDSETGIPVSIVDGNWVTAIRTAAGSAVVANRMARTESESICFIGCGVQAVSHLDLFNDMFPLKKVFAYGRGQANRDKLCKHAVSLGLIAEDCTDPKAAVANADIIVSSVTLTAKIEPFIDPHWLKPGAFLSSTDTALPFMPQGMDAFERIIIDDLEQEAAMPEPMVEPKLVGGDLTKLVCGEIDGRTDDSHRYAFVFRAIALGDLALSALAYDKALESGAGIDLN